MPKLLQPSMSGGELAPGLQARVDVARYAVSLSHCRNFRTKHTGGIVKRTGTRFCGEVYTDFGSPFDGDDDPQYRIIAFIVSNTVRYLLELGHKYMRVWQDCALVEADESDEPLFIVTPWDHRDLVDLRFTQSADVMYFTHQSYPPQELRRTSATNFEMTEYVHKNGPFRPLNSNPSARVSASAAVGDVELVCNVDMFTEDMVGALVYLEEPELRSIKPWEPAAKNIPDGEYRRSDGKVYKAVSHQTGGSAGTPYYITGNIRPSHDNGRAFDGSGDVRNDGVNDYAVGVEWEYLHSGFGIVKITEFVDEKTVNGEVQSRVPESCVTSGGGIPVNTWTFTGDDIEVEFDITGAVAESVGDYEVFFDGVGVPP